MRHCILTLTAGLLLAGVAGTPKAAQAKHKAGHKAASVKCPNCGMMLTTKKTKAAPRAVKINGKTYYCCTACGPHTKKAAKG